MKTKTINIILCNKFDAWLNSIENETVKNLVSKNTIITGGCIVSMLQNEPVNDFDIYFRNYETAFAVTNYYVGKFLENPTSRFKKKYFGNGDDSVGKAIPISVHVDKNTEPYKIEIVVKSQGIASEEGTQDYQYFEGLDPGSPESTKFIENVMSVVDGEDQKEKPPFRPVFLSSNAIMLSDKIQLICRFYGEPEKIHENYDFVHCTNYWDSKTRRVVLNPEALETILTKELRYIGSKYPICSVIRTRKFITRGWTINAGQYLKMLLQISKMDLTNIGVLKDQLIGVDTAYFNEVIRKLQEKDAKVVDGAYLLEILDRMF